MGLGDESRSAFDVPTLVTRIRSVTTADELSLLNISCPTSPILLHGGSSGHGLAARDARDPSPGQCRSPIPERTDAFFSREWPLTTRVGATVPRRVVLASRGAIIGPLGRGSAGAYVSRAGSR